MQKPSQSTSWELAGVPDSQKGVYRFTQNLVGRRKEGEKGRVSRRDLHAGVGRAETAVRSPHWGSLLGGRGSVWGCWSVKQWVCDNLRGVRTSQSVLQPYVSQTGTRVHWSAQQLGARGGRAVPGQGLLSTLGDGLREQEGEDCGREWVWREARRLWRQGATAESHARGGAIYVVSLPMLAPAASPQRKPSERVAFWVPAAPNNREGPAREALWTPAARGYPKILIAPLATGFPMYLALSGSLQSKQLCPLHLSSLGRTQVLQGGLRSNAYGWPTSRGRDKTTTELQEWSG